MKDHVNSLTDVIWTIENEIEEIEKLQQKKSCSVTAYVKMQDRAIALLECIELLKKIRNEGHEP